MNLRALPCLVLLVACTSTTSPLETFSLNQERNPAEDPQYAQAKLFDDWFRGKLKPDEHKAYEEGCRQAPTSHPFCFTVFNRALLTAKTREIENEMRPSRYRGPTVRPKFDSSLKISNLSDLKSAPVQGILRGLPKNQIKKLTALKETTLQETQCPNNLAIGLAASLEDRLDQDVTFNDIARLYEKGAQCLDSNPNEQEPLLTRAALFYIASKDYAPARDLLSKASALSGVFTGRSLYWLHRTQLLLSETAPARRTLETLKAKYPFSFHSLVAQSAAGKDPGDVLSKETTPVLKRSKLCPELNALLEQAETLSRLGFEKTAGQVLTWATVYAKIAEPEALLYVVQLKNALSDHKSKLIILSDVLYQNPHLISRTTLELYFPKVYFPIFEKQSEILDPFLLLAVALRESAFNSTAVSGAKARGLLQLLPGTARRLKKKANLFDPETNINIGAQYIVNMLARTEGRLPLALAAYNAGPGKVATWVKLYPMEDPVLFIDLVPFKETREYIGSVLRNYYWYRRIHKSPEPIEAGKILEVASLEPASTH